MVKIKNNYIIPLFLLFFGVFLVLTLSSDTKLVYAANGTNQTNTSYGNLYVNTNPSVAYTYVDGVYRGLSPITVSNLYVGTHLVKVSKSGYQDNQVNVNLVSGQTTSVYITLTPASNQTNQTQTGNVWVITNPQGANVYLDNIFKGTSPRYIDSVSVGSHIVKATLAGYQDNQRTIYVYNGQLTNVSLILTPQLPNYTYICNDSDGGLMYNLKGNTKVTRSDGVVITTRTDTCTTNSTSNLDEFYCQSPTSNYVAVKSYKCPYGCSDGRCMSGGGGGGRLPYQIQASPLSSLWLVWVIGIIVIAFLIVLWTKRKKGRSK